MCHTHGGGSVCEEVNAGGSPNAVEASSMMYSSSTPRNVKRARGALYPSGRGTTREKKSGMRHEPRPTSKIAVFLRLKIEQCKATERSFSAPSIEEFALGLHVQRGPKSELISRVIIKSYKKTASAATFIINFEFGMSIRILLVCIKYLMCDIICDVNSAVFEAATWVKSNQCIR